MKVLIADDNPDDLMMLRLVVEREGHEAIEAKNGQQGLELAAAHRPDVIISDALMPVLDGFNFLRKLKEDPILKAIPFIFYSATYQEEKDVGLAAALGALGYIFKPRPHDRLWPEIEELIYKGRTVKSAAAEEMTDVEYLLKYSAMIATKLEQKVVELEKALAERDETEKALLKAREEWEWSFASIGDIALILSPDLKIIQANREAYAVLASGPGQELLGKFCYEAFQEGEHPCSACPGLFTGQMPKGQTWEIEHKALGKIFQVSVSPVLDSEGRVVSFIYFSKDITTQKELAARLNQAQKMEAIGTLSCGIAHDFNNILSAIFGYLELATVEKDPVQRDRDLEQVRVAAERAKELVKQILAFSRRADQEKYPLQIALIVKEALKMLRASIPATIEIRQEITSKATVLADATQIHQILMNLCTNAYHAMRETGGTLSVFLGEIEIQGEDAGYGELIPGRYVHLEVSDTGCGMSPEVQEKVFEPYFTTKKIGEGTGLGLAVVHGIVKTHNGSITVCSEPGRGTSFHVFLPLVAEPAVERPVKEALENLHGKGERILFVEDEEQIREFAKEFFSRNGYQVTVCSNAVQALEEFQNLPGQYDLIITDMTMPHMNGAEFAQKVLGIKQEIPIILCTGQSELINREKALGVGVFEYLVKPVGTHDLLSAIRRALDKNGTTRQTLPG